MAAFAGVVQPDAVEQVAGDRFLPGTHRSDGAQANQVVQRGDASAGAFVQVAPVLAGQAARLVLEEHQRVFQGLDHADPPGRLVLAGHAEWGQFVVGEPSGGLRGAFSAATLGQQRAVFQVDAGADQGAGRVVGQVLDVVVGGAAFSLAAIQEVEVVDFTDRWEPPSRSDLCLRIDYMSATARVR